ncbi:tetratricopeptide repeat protein [Leptospirillum ferrooxidans]|uniref:Putative SAM-dependent methyltransferase n=1 Tax=Leptospirillum ferrooxidans (strain C2-3) TaxID=1162668 RepID=I0IR62_LEPFC|nr:tetratricopeptide repeat protein [Leptospirillum ferrooxidans]BAM07761.1 putative SAM-dependent methyltransferase [Leptospirillum ferrooxidans C2-3]
MVHILTFNWHEGYLTLLGKIPDIRLTIVERQKGGYSRWMTEFRPCPRGSRIVSEQLAMEELARGGFDLVIAHDPTDLLLTKESSVPQILVLHNRITTMLALGGNKVSREEYLEWFSGLTGMVPDLEIVAISKSKAMDWGLDGIRVIEPGVDPDVWGPYEGNNRVILRVGNFLKERDLMMGGSVGEQAIGSFPSLTVGLNPSITGSMPSAGLSDLIAAYRSSRVYLHTTIHPWEDGYNLSLLEAMASGLPVVALDHPGSPVIHGRSGFLEKTLDGLHQRLSWFLDHPSEARAMGEKAREDILRQFPLDRFIGKWSSVIGEKFSRSQERKKDREERSDLLALIPGGARTILEIGCRKGSIGRGIRERFSGITIWGIESNSEQCDLAKPHYDRIFCQNEMDCGAEIPPNSIDVLLLPDILSRIADPSAFLKEYMHCLSESGVVIAAIPNIRYHEVLSGMLSGNFDLGDPGISGKSGFFSKKAIASLMSRTGLWVEVVSPALDGRYKQIVFNEKSQSRELMDVDIGPMVVKGQDEEGVRDLFTVEYLLVCRRKVRAILDRIEMLSTDDDSGVLEILTESREDPWLSEADRAEIHLKEGEIHARAGRFEMAIASYEQSFPVLDPKRDERPSQGIALSYLLTGRYDQAIHWFKRAFDLNPGCWQALTGFGMCCQSLGRLEDALFYYGQSLAMEPSQEELPALMIQTARSLEDAEQAAGLLLGLVESYPHSPLLRREYARFLLEHGRDDEAYEHLRLVLADNSKDGEAIRMLSRIPMRRDAVVRGL